MSLLLLLNPTIRGITPFRERIHGFLEPDNDMPDHFAAVGRVVTAFNGIDVILNIILRAQLGVETKIGRAVIGGMRTGDMLSAIRRLAKAQGKDGAWLAEYERVRKDIQTFKDIRDDVAHKIWAVADRQMRFSNSYVARDDDGIETEIYSIDDLNALARYAARLSEEMLNLFPGTATPLDGTTTPRERPSLLSR
jgi:hypothetical protein